MASNSFRVGINGYTVLGMAKNVFPSSEPVSIPHLSGPDMPLVSRYFAPTPTRNF